MKTKECKCSEKHRKYNEKYDARYCDVCNIWLELPCIDESCEYCKDRPDKPSEAKDVTALK